MSKVIINILVNLKVSMYVMKTTGNQNENNQTVFLARRVMSSTTAAFFNRICSNLTLVQSFSHLQKALHPSHGSRGRSEP